MTPVAAVESPLRRSDASRLFRTPRSVAEEQEVNDDEAERRIRRSAASLDDSTASVGGGGSGTAEANEHIKMCLQLYSDNKLSKDNAWSVTIIDAFSKLMSRHSSTLQNFQVAGSTLEASTKVYGLRVDSVHTDVMRMCSELTRQSARTMDNNRDEQDDDDDEGGSNKENDASMAAGGDGAGGQTQDPKVKKKRARKHVSTITKNKETINGPLDTNPFTDPFFAKLNSVVGDVNSSSRLMQNIVPTVEGELRLRMDYKFWDEEDAPEIDLETDQNYENSELSTVTIAKLLTTSKLHTMLSGYVITDAPAEDDSDEAPLLDTQDAQVRDIANDDMGLNRSALDVQFDIDAEPEPIPVGDAYIIDYASADVMGGPDADDDFNEDDQIALQNCRGLKRKTVVIEDMRPIDSSSSNLEYSYRALDMISQFWAGPSHWKFKRSKGVSLRFSSVVGSETSKAKPKEKQTRKKKRFEVDTLDDIISVEDHHYQGYSQNRPVKNITHLKSMICKKWDSKKLKLPTDFHLERNRFDVNTCARGLKVRDFDSVPEPDDAPADEYSYDDPVDHNYSGRGMNDPAEGEAGPGFGAGAGDDHQTFDDIAATGEGATGIGGAGGATLNTSLDFIPTEFHGAPDKVTKIHIAYAKTAKVVDMKQLKTCCWRLITEQISSSGSSSTAPSEGKATFSEIYRELPHILSKSMSENISKSLAFYSVLHLSNERSLRLVRQDDLEDFQILPTV